MSKKERHKDRDRDIGRERERESGVCLRGKMKTRNRAVYTHTRPQKSTNNPKMTSHKYRVERLRLISPTYLVSHVTRNGKSRIVAIVRPVRTQMPDVHLNRRVIFARDQAVCPRALSRDVQIDVFSVSVNHCFGG